MTTIQATTEFGNAAAERVHVSKDGSQIFITVYDLEFTELLKLRAKFNVVRTIERDRVTLIHIEDTSNLWKCTDRFEDDYEFDNQELIDTLWMMFLERGESGVTWFFMNTDSSLTQDSQSWYEYGHEDVIFDFFGLSIRQTTTLHYA